MKNKQPVPNERDENVNSISKNRYDPRQEALERELRNFSNMKPEIVAQLIRKWMNKDE